MDDREIRNPDMEYTARGAAVAAEKPGALFQEQEAAGLRSRWDAIQAAFVDEPRKAVQEADNLVASVMNRMTDMFGEERNNLEHQWDRGDSVSTEDLRVALQRYRSFFTRLLSI
ncbi:MAG: hypothetical protein ACM336_09365 [Acidobacteriota bacterium]